MNVIYVGVVPRVYGTAKQTVIQYKNVYWNEYLDVFEDSYLALQNNAHSAFEIELALEIATRTRKKSVQFVISTCTIKS